MSRDDPNVRLRHMLDYSREAVALLRDRKRADLESERTLGLAILRCVEIVGEAASRVPVDIQQCYQNIPWPQVMYLRQSRRLCRLLAPQRGLLAKRVKFTSNQQ
jgi:uncharacterized protein with HEPN domain